jgi:hypothetical protein
MSGGKAPATSVRQQVSELKDMLRVVLNKMDELEAAIEASQELKAPEEKPSIKQEREANDAGPFLHPPRGFQLGPIPGATHYCSCDQGVLAVRFCKVCKKSMCFNCEATHWEQYARLDHELVTQIDPKTQVLESDRRRVDTGSKRSKGSKDSKRSKRSNP